MTVGLSGRISPVLRRKTFLTYACLIGLVCLLHAAPTATSARSAESIYWTDWREFKTYFDFNSDQITTDGLEVCQAFAKLAVDARLKRVIIVGHADTAGSTTYNKILSQSRAQAVANKLIQFGVAREIIEIEAKGETDVQAQTPNDTREVLNRNVDIQFLLKENEQVLTAYVNSKAWHETRGLP